MDQARIYDEAAEQYDALVTAEDCDGNLLPAIESVVPLAGASVLEVGAGTGRVTRLVLPRARRVVAVERSIRMLAVARRRIRASVGAARFLLVHGDARALGVADGWADVAIAGWVFGHFPYWMPDRWREETAQALGEIERALRPGGCIVVLETLGTGTDEAAPPTAELAAYYAWLEDARGFSRLALRTDYRFTDVETAASRLGFFFGRWLAQRVRDEGWTRVPEHTGLWWRRYGTTGDHADALPLSKPSSKT